LKRDGVEYYNSGSWTQDVPTYIAIDQRGVRVWDYKEDAAESQVKVEHEAELENLLAE
jgi:hypothetical protein